MCHFMHKVSRTVKAALSGMNNLSFTPKMPIYGIACLI